MTDNDIQFMIEGVATEIAVMLSQDLGLNVQESLDILYNSETYSKLTDRKTGLYFQSSRYVYSFLKAELATGKIA